MRQVALMLGVCAACSATGRLPAQQPGSAAAQANSISDGAGQTADADRKRRIEFLKQELEHYSMAAADRRETPLPATEEAVLRYSNPVRNFFSDGAVFLWLEEQRPLAAAVLSIRAQGLVVREFTSLSGRALECRRDGKLVWSPRAAGLVEQSLADAPPPDVSGKSSGNRRLRQMRDIARRFRVIKKSEPDVDLRLMPQPIYRFAADGEGLIDGAVFAFVEATDPDFLLVVGAQRGDAASAGEWRYTLARMSSTPMEVELDGHRVWSAEGYWSNPRSPSDPYAEMPFGKYPPQ